jgi:hypothetical protein
MDDPRPPGRDRGSQDLLSDLGHLDLLKDGVRGDFLRDPGVQDLVKDLGSQDAAKIGSMRVGRPPTEIVLTASPSLSGGYAFERQRFRSLLATDSR